MTLHPLLIILFLTFLITISLLYLDIHYRRQNPNIKTYATLETDLATAITQLIKSENETMNRERDFQHHRSDIRLRRPQFHALVTLREALEAVRMLRLMEDGGIVDMGGGEGSGGEDQGWGDEEERESESESESGSESEGEPEVLSPSLRRSARIADAGEV